MNYRNLLCVEGFPSLIRLRRELPHLREPMDNESLAALQWSVSGNHSATCQPLWNALDGGFLAALGMTFGYQPEYPLE